MAVMLEPFHGTIVNSAYCLWLPMRMTFSCNRSLIKHRAMGGCHFPQIADQQHSLVANDCLVMQAIRFPARENVVRETDSGGGRPSKPPHTSAILTELGSAKGVSFLCSCCILHNLYQFLRMESRLTEGFLVLAFVFITVLQIDRVGGSAAESACSRWFPRTNVVRIG